jgi:hypothetical protein
MGTTAIITPPRRLPRVLVRVLAFWLVLEGVIAATIYCRPATAGSFGHAHWFRYVSTLVTLIYADVVCFCLVLWGLGWLVLTVLDFRRATRGLEPDVRDDP